ncbi:putative glycosyltransferase EpsJ [Lachnospiraceae bacterium]|nr:putative glycosyltransferase EpsJ [Lachnospiraceae bacterium]
MSIEQRIPKVSVIIPICNAEKYLKECIESVLGQTLRDIEVICVDDGSKDNSLSIIQTYAQKDSRVKVITKKNSGYGDSVNHGLRIAKGVYIGIVESDDFIATDMYDKLYKLSEGGTIDCIKGNFWDYYCWEGKKRKDKKDEAIVNRERTDMPEEEEIFTIRQDPHILWGHPSIWSGIYRREFLERHKIEFMAEPGGGWVDNPFFFQTLCLAQSIRWTEKPYYYYRKTNSMSSSNNQTDLTIPLRRMMDNLDVLEKYNYKDEDILNFVYARALMYLCGVLQEKNYGKQIDTVRIYAQKLMERLNGEIIKKNFHIYDQANYFRYLSPLQIIMEKSGKILIYNWVPFDNPWHIGGGVNIYCYNLISTILKERPDIQVYFLSSGWAYDLSTTKCYIRKIGNIFGERCRTFEIVNSPVPAAQNFLLNHPETAFENEVLKNVLSSFLQDYGPFKVVHFNNIEGLSLDAIDLKKDFPEAKFIYSMHNYVPICVTGFYYQRHNKCNCLPGHSYNDCMKCTNIGRRTDLCKEIVKRAKEVTDIHDCIEEQKWIKAFGFDKLDEIGETKKLIEFCERAVDVINNMDCILAVSKRVKKIAVENGIDEQKTKVSYIGTRIAEHQIQTAIAKPGKYFKIAYLGSDAYFAEKGYPFLLEAFSALDEKDKKQIDLLLTTTNGNIYQMKKQLEGFHSVKIVKGYTHADLKYLLKDVNLGVIPVLWEDNLPQIAIEMAAIGVPVLSSSFGGASELCSDDLFCFQGGDINDFQKHLLYFLNNPHKLSLYWEKSHKLVTMNDHWKELEEIYGVTRVVDTNITLEQYGILLEENELLYRNLNDRNYFESELHRVTTSISYKLGMSITYIPRKIRKAYRHYKRYGLKDIGKRVMARLSLGSGIFPSVH